MKYSKIVNLGLLYLVKLKIQTYSSWRSTKCEIVYSHECFVEIIGLWKQHSPVGDISGMWIKQKKVCPDVATCSASQDLILF